MSRNLTFPSGAPGSGPPCLKTRRSGPFRIPRPDRIPLHGEPSPLFFPKNRFLPHPPCRERPCRGALPLGAPPGRSPFPWGAPVGTIKDGSRQVSIKRKTERTRTRCERGGSGYQVRRSCFLSRLIF